MNDPKTLRDIAEQACIFDRAHFDDDVEPIPEAIISNHERLPSDRKLITRLRPRHAVALGYFEGYAKAVEIASVMRRNIKEQIGADPNRNLFGALADLVKERDELRKRVIVDIELPTADEIDNWIAIGESTGPIPEKGEGNIRDIVARNGLEYVVAQLKKRIPEQANIGIVKKPPPPPPPAAPPLPNELKLSTEIDDELAQAAADYANKLGGDAPSERDRKYAKSAANGDEGFLPEWDSVVRNFVEGARWQQAVREREVFADGTRPELPKELSDDVQAGSRGLSLEEAIRRYGTTLPNLNKPSMEIDGHLLRKQPDPSDDSLIMKALLGNPSVASVPIVFRDDNERDFWDAQVRMRAGDNTPQSIARAADEMIEERRARLPIAKQVRDELREPEGALPGYDAFCVHDNVCIRFGREGAIAEFGMNDERFRGKSAKAIATMIRADLGQRKVDRAAEEITDELLLETVRHAHAYVGSEPAANDLEIAKLIISGNDMFQPVWLSAIRSYLAGALRKARNP